MTWVSPKTPKRHSAKINQNHMSQLQVSSERTHLTHFGFENRSKSKNLFLVLDISPGASSWQKSESVCHLLSSGCNANIRWRSRGCIHSHQAWARVISRRNLDLIEVPYCQTQRSKQNHHKTEGEMSFEFSKANEILSWYNRVKAHWMLTAIGTLQVGLPRAKAPFPQARGVEDVPAENGGESLAMDNHRVLVYAKNLRLCGGSLRSVGCSLRSIGSSSLRSIGGSLCGDNSWLCSRNTWRFRIDKNPVIHWHRWRRSRRSLRRSHLHRPQHRHCWSSRRHNSCHNRGWSWHIRDHSWHIRDHSWHNRGHWQHRRRCWSSQSWHHMHRSCLWQRRQSSRTWSIRLSNNKMNRSNGTLSKNPVSTLSEKVWKHHTDL